MSSELLRLENVNLQLDSFHLSNIHINLFENEIHVIMGEWAKTARAKAS